MKLLNLIYFALLLFASGSVMAQVRAGNVAQRVSGTYLSHLTSSTSNCNCSNQGYVQYLGQDGKTYYLTVCFDSEKGDFYQLYHNEPITVDGIVKSTPCGNTNYLVMHSTQHYVNNNMQRQVIPKPNFSSSNKQGQRQVNETGTIVTLTGDFVERGSTMSDWSAFDGVDCVKCGVFYDDFRTIINLDGTDINKDDLYRMGTLTVTGTKIGKIVYVTSYRKGN